MSQITASTQAHLDIEDIIDDLVILKDATVVIVLETTSFNFDLLSEIEQDSMIAAFGHFLNSLSFPLQVCIRTKKMDVSTYLDRLSDFEGRQTNLFLKEKIKNYRQFIGELIAKNEVLDKRFYLVVPFQEIALSAPSFDPLALLLGRASSPHFNKIEVLAKAKIQLKPKKEQVISQLNSVGLRAKQLNTQELVELFYDIYNPDANREQKIRIAATEYSSYFIEPSIGA